jgi:spoIIIJ-associated protein
MDTTLRDSHAEGRDQTMNQDTIDEVFCEGRNVEEALQAACDKLNTTPNQVEHEVVRVGTNGGVLGFLRGRTTRIRVWKKSQGQIELTRCLKQFFEHLGLVSEFKVVRADDAYEVTIDTDGADGLLIGRGGETLAALQHIVSRMASKIDEGMRVRVDVAGYRRRRQEQLRKKAAELAERSHATGKDQMTEPLPADERRIVHLALSEDARVETHAVGDGLTKRIIVSPTGQPARSGGAAEEAGREMERPRSLQRLGRSGRGGGRSRSGERGGAPRRTERSRSDSSRGPGERSGPPRERGERHERIGRNERDPRDESGRREERGERHTGSEPPERGERTERPEREQRTERPEREQRPERDRSDRPGRATRGEPSRSREADTRPDEAPKAAPAEEDSYFRIPDTIGLISSPTSSPEGGEQGGEEAGASADQPRTFGRKPRPGRGRRR